MKRKLLIISLILVFVLVLSVGCKKTGGDDPTPTKEPDTTATPEPEVTEEPTPTPEPGPQTYVDDDFSEDYPDEPPMLDGWHFWDVTNGGNSKVYEQGDNKYFRIQGFISMTYLDLFETPYTFQFDARGVKADEVGAVFVRGNKELTVPVSKNPTGAGYYEADDSGTKFTSTTGIGLWFKENGKLTLFIKTLDTSKPAKIGNCFAEIECSYSASNWNKIRIDDDCKGTIKYYVNDDLIATIEYSDLGTYDDFDPLFDGENFYKKAVIKDKDGNELASTDSAFIYEYSEIAFGMRTAAIDVDNLLLKDLELEE
jgi:hypothetical protein